MGMVVPLAPEFHSHTLLSARCAGKLSPAEMVLLVPSVTARESHSLTIIDVEHAAKRSDIRTAKPRTGR